MLKILATRLVSLITLATSVTAAQSAPPRKEIPAIAKAANGSIVSIVMSDKNGKPVAQGSGFFVSKDGLIVTNYHVIAEGVSAVAKLPDGAFYLIDGVLASDKARDVAILKAQGHNFRALTLGNSDRVLVGEEVVAIGNPLFLESTVSNGIVSGVRTVREEGGKFLQITAPISPGSSGGPLFNTSGEVIGITTMYLKGGENLNFAIPINDAKPLLKINSSELQDFPDEPEPVETHETQMADLLQQKMCKEQAERTFEEYKEGRMVHAEIQAGYGFYGYTSHYNAKASRCFIEINGRTVYEGKEIQRHYLIEDPFENQSYGGLILGGKVDGRHSNYLNFCEVDPPDGQPEIKCKSEEEFNDLVLKYFGITAK